MATSKLYCTACYRFFEATMALHRQKHHTFEFIALLATAGLKFVIMDALGMRAFFIVGICLFWGGYVYRRWKADHSVLQYWGFRKEGFRRSMFLLIPFLLASLWFMFVFARINQIALFNPHILPVLLLYPLWGIVQQFMMICIVREWLSRNRLFSLKPYPVLFVTSLLFSLIHFPDSRLMIFTLAMEVVFLFVYYRWRNMWALGLTHGWIGTFLLYYVHDRDLWLELFAWFQM